jgi:hypothetical protein
MAKSRKGAFVGLPNRDCRTFLGSIVSLIGENMLWQKEENFSMSAEQNKALIHYGVLLSGRMKVVADDGSETEIGPGDAYIIAPGHDGWVVGDEPARGIEFSREAVERFAKG